MILDDPRLPEFLEAQVRDHACRTELEPGLWLLFAVPAADGPGNSFARTLLAEAKFPHDSGATEDDQWTLYYVDTASRPEAIYWLEDLGRMLTGEVRPVSPAQLALIRELPESQAPHRLAQRLGEMHAAGQLSAGAIREPALVRALLDRMHAMEPLYFAAMHTVLSHHLVDMVIWLGQMIPEDVQLKNDIVKAGLSRDPFLQRRQDAAAEIRNYLIRFHVISPLDQQKNTSAANPYAAFLEIVRKGDGIIAPLDGVTQNMACAHVVSAVQAIRRNLYRGEAFSSFDTQSPWMTGEIALPFRFIKQQLEFRIDLAPLDGLYMLERAVVA